MILKIHCFPKRRYDCIYICHNFVIFKSQHKKGVTQGQEVKVHDYVKSSFEGNRILGNIYLILKKS